MSEAYLGEIRMFAGNFAPTGWMFCHGQLLSISEYTVLYDLLGATYGGDGQTTFALPNLQSRIPVHRDSNEALGQMGGAETVTLWHNQLPVHTHPALASGTAGDATAPEGRVWAAVARSAYSSAAPTTPMAPGSLQSAGGSQPHQNMPPYLCLSFIIAVSGIFPTPV